MTLSPSPFCDAYSHHCVTPAPTPTQSATSEPGRIADSGHALPFTGFDLTVGIALGCLLIAVGLLLNSSVWSRRC